MTRLSRLLTSLTHLGSRWLCVLFVCWTVRAFSYFFLCAEKFLGQKLMKTLFDDFRSNHLLTRSCFLHRLRNLSRICRRNLMTSRRKNLEKTLREQPSSCFQKSRNYNCKCLSIDLFASTRSSVGFPIHSICSCELNVVWLLWYLWGCSCLAALWVRACMMMAVWSLLITKTVLPIRHFCTSPLLWRRSSAEECQ